MKKNIPKKQTPAGSPTKNLVTRRFRKSLPELRKYLGLEADNALEELAESFLDFLDDVGTKARDKAIADAIDAIPTTGRELVERLIRLRDRKGKKGGASHE